MVAVPSDIHKALRAALVHTRDPADQGTDLESK